MLEEGSDTESYLDADQGSPVATLTPTMKVKTVRTARATTDDSEGDDGRRAGDGLRATGEGRRTTGVQ